MVNFLLQDEKLYYGPDARQIVIENYQDYDEAVEIKPPTLKFAETQWKCAFIQTRSNVRQLQPGTLFLYCKSYKNSKELFSLYALSCVL